MVQKENFIEIKELCQEKEISLVAVSKKQPNEKIHSLYHLGQRDFGENRVEELQNKRALFPQDIKWHFIGHLQSKKVKLLQPFPYLIQSVDSLKLLSVLQKEAEKRNEWVGILIQIKIAEEDTKYGFDILTSQTVIEDLLVKKTYPNLKLRGLMGMATYTDDALQIEREFHRIADFISDMRAKYPTHPEALKILSIGMSDDYTIAINSQSNMIRIGSAIFGHRKY